MNSKDPSLSMRCSKRKASTASRINKELPQISVIWKRKSTRTETLNWEVGKASEVHVIRCHWEKEQPLWEVLPKILHTQVGNNQSWVDVERRSGPAAKRKQYRKRWVSRVIRDVSGLSKAGHSVNGHARKTSQSKNTSTHKCWKVVSWQRCVRSWSLWQSQNSCITSATVIGKSAQGSSSIRFAKVRIFKHWELMSRTCESAESELRFSLAKTSTCRSTTGSKCSIASLRHGEELTKVMRVLKSRPSSRSGRLNRSQQTKDLSGSTSRKVTTEASNNLVSRLQKWMKRKLLLSPDES